MLAYRRLLYSCGDLMSRVVFSSLWRCYFRCNYTTMDGDNKDDQQMDQTDETATDMMDDGEEEKGDEEETEEEKTD